MANVLKIRKKVSVNNMTMSVLLLATVILLCLKEVISNCPPNSGK